MKSQKKLFKSMVILLVVLLMVPYHLLEVMAAQPTKQSGTGTYKTSTNTFWDSQGYSLMFGGHTTSVSINDDAVLYSGNTTSPKWNKTFSIAVLSGNERRARGSLRVLTSRGTYEYYNYEIRINPKNFDRDNLKVGRSLLDNLYSESGVNKADLDLKLARGGTAWINAIKSMRTSSQSHSSMRTKRLWSNGKSNYTVPTRTFSTSAIINNGNFTSFTENILKAFYDNKFTFPQIDDAPPVRSSFSISASQGYKESNSVYWVRPNVETSVMVRQRDTGVGNLYQYFRVYRYGYSGSGDITARSRHTFTNTSTTNHVKQVTSSDFSINSVKRSENTSYGKLTWKMTPKVNNTTFYLEHYFSDKLNNNSGYTRFQTLKTDGTAPSADGISLTGADYKNGSDYWVKPNTTVTLKIGQKDTRSGNQRQYLKIDGGSQVRAWHNFHSGSTHIDSVGSFDQKNSDIEINSLSRTTSGNTGTVSWKIKPKKDLTTFKPTYHFRDNVYNVRGYDTSHGGDTGVRIRTDGKKPTVSASKTSQGWTSGNINVSLDYSDQGSGIKTKQYAWSTSTSKPSSWNNYSSSLTLSSQGTRYLHYRAIDNVGNETTGYFGPYRIDKNAPSVSFSPNGNSTYEKSHSTKVSVSDSVSGVKTRQYVWTKSTSQPTSGWTNFSNGATLSTPTSTGNHYLWVKTTDNGGNQAIVRSNVFKVDRTSPNGSLSASTVDWTNEDVVLRISGISDAHSGYKHIVRPDGSVTTATSFNYSVRQNGTYTFTIYDKAGNTKTLKHTVTTIERDKPTVNIEKIKQTNTKIDIRLHYSDE